MWKSIIIKYHVPHQPCGTRASVSTTYLNNHVELNHQVPLTSPTVWNPSISKYHLPTVWKSIIIKYHFPHQPCGTRASVSTTYLNNHVELNHQVPLTSPTVWNPSISKYHLPTVWKSIIIKYHFPHQPCGTRASVSTTYLNNHVELNHQVPLTSSTMWNSSISKYHLPDKPCGARVSTAYLTKHVKLQHHLVQLTSPTVWNSSISKYLPHQLCGTPTLVSTVYLTNCVEFKHQ